MKLGKLFDLSVRNKKAYFVIACLILTVIFLSLDSVCPVVPVIFAVLSLVGVAAS